MILFQTGCVSAPRIRKMMRNKQASIETSERQRGFLNDHIFEVQCSLVFLTGFSRYFQGHHVHADKANADHTHDQKLLF